MQLLPEGQPSSPGSPFPSRAPGTLTHEHRSRAGSLGLPRARAAPARAGAPQASGDGGWRSALTACWSADLAAWARSERAVSAH